MRGIRDVSKSLVLLCSPRENGTTDELALYFIEGYKRESASIDVAALRDHDIRTCVNCGYCSSHPLKCVFDIDDATTLLERFLAARLVVFASPVYFYGPPATLKALIDRGQKYWTGFREELASGHVIELLAAGRVAGERVFEGTKLILNCFSRVMNKNKPRAFSYRGLENPGDISPEIISELRSLGASVARAVRDEQ